MPDPWTHNSPTGIVNGTTTSTLVMGLLPAMRYHFRVSAENDVGTSNYSDVVSSTTLEEGKLGFQIL